ncbi:MAG TPA: hypothetical protein VFX59_29245 [Polyangiales bacterium]|nr:hypothetical protein [Polyangiales bacterium]
MLVASAALMSPPVRAQDAAPVVDDERARAHYLAGESHFAAERFRDAAREFELAYDLSHRQEMLINLSRAHERAGDLDKAIADLELLLQTFPGTSYTLEAEQRLAAMRAKQPVPAPVAVEEAPAPAPSPEPASQSALAARVWPPRWPTLVVGSVAIAAGVAALATGLRAHGLHGDLQDRCPNDLCSSGFEPDRDKGRALSRASTGLLFSSIALAGVTAALWVVDYRRDKRVQLGINGSSAQLRMQF